ncbi:gephyrin-like molybdotransferase receptor GlpR [Streptomyces flavidovirens]|uniref:divisome protein SepX/GlpR n=1 Tax=Streptomyces flavidovirens TaxID=67298 RepID=UPI0034416217
MSSSGLIYAVIVGAWAAYLVPMWLRRQDELNEARPTERFSTAIRLLSGRAAMERRYARELRERAADEAEPDVDPDAVTDRLSSVDVRAFAVPPTQTERPAARQEARQNVRENARESARESVREERRVRTASAAAERARRSKVLARRRRTTVILFLAFTLGAIVAAVGGLRFLWAPAVPAVLLSTYIVHLRATERRRFAFTMDRRRAEAAAQRLRERRPHPGRRPVSADPDEEPVVRPEPEPAPAVSPQEAGRRALVEQTDHAEWVDQQRERERGSARGESWDPVPVPLPTYVTAPVAPRATGSVDFGDPGTWSSARSSTAEPTPATEPPPAAEPAPGRRPANPARRDRGHGRTPLFDQYEEGDRPRAANE